MDAHLDGGSSAPLYQQVLDLLKSDIEQGTYPVDSQIPTELELSKMYGVGRVTVRRAIEELVGEGYLTKRQGRGTFVTATKIIRKVHQKDDVQSFTQACAENGMKAGAPSFIYTTFMYIVLGLLSLLVPSSSGLAALTMPVMGPLTELMGLNPEAAVTALQFANQTVNTISPVAGMTVAGLAVAKISFGQWWKTIWKFFIFMVLFGLVATVISGLLPM